MNIGGFTTMTLLDYPGKTACTIFTAGCNFNCPFCHNGQLVLGSNTEKFLDNNEIFRFLKTRQKLLDGICISGGEPTIQQDILEFIYRIKSMGFKVKLDTNGYKPDVVEDLIQGNLIDYIAMDIKAPLDKYSKFVGCKEINTSKIVETISIIKESLIEYEFRTTLVKGMHELADIKPMAELLISKSDGYRGWYLQNYKEGDNILYKLTASDERFASFSNDEMKIFLQEACLYNSNSFLRGVD